MIGSICDLKGVPRGTVWLPHDARAKTLQTGRSIVEQFVDADILPQIVPNLSIMDGISAARLLFPQVRLNKEETKDGVMALKSYHREFNEDKKIFMDSPVHDWSSHFADGFRYFGVVAQKKPLSKRARSIDEALAGAQGNHYAFTLDDLWHHRTVRQDSDWRM
jgi:phage terminase large subunit